MSKPEKMNNYLKNRDRAPANPCYGVAFRVIRSDI